MLIERIYHPYWLWEEVEYNMWGTVDKKDIFLKKAIMFTKRHELYGKWMLRVVRQWKYSCEHNLSNYSSNRRAWIGHAACALAFKCPENIVRSAWSHLSKQQQIDANKQADNAIAFWEQKYMEKS